MSIQKSPPLPVFNQGVMVGQVLVGSLGYERLQQPSDVPLYVRDSDK